MLFLSLPSSFQFYLREPVGINHWRLLCDFVLSTYLLRKLFGFRIFNSVSDKLRTIKLLDTTLCLRLQLFRFRLRGSLARMAQGSSVRVHQYSKWVFLCLQSIPSFAALCFYFLFPRSVDMALESWTAQLCGIPFGWTILVWVVPCCVSFLH